MRVPRGGWIAGGGESLTPARPGKVEKSGFGVPFSALWRHLNAMKDEALVDSAWRTRERAYAPYSEFKVGAALLAADGRVFTGCNVENLSYGLTICAERVAIGGAIAAGAREFSAIAIVADTGVPVSPCGACRQVMAEFGIPRIILANRTGREEHTLEALLPRAKAGILDRAE